MDVTIPTAPEPEQDDARGAGESSNNSHTPDSNLIMSTPNGGESSAPLGTPRERLQILQLETRNSALAGLPIKYDFRLVNGVSTLVLIVSAVSECPACKWWMLEGLCDNRRCARYQIQTTPAP